MDVLEAKRALRERVVRSRAALGPEERAAAAASCARIVDALPAWQAARTVALYAPIGAEMDTAELARRAAAAGKRVAWPLVRPGEAVLAFAACAPGDLVPGPLGTRQPPASSPPVPLADVDLVVVPGVAFDGQGRRLGRGRGHYDATLAALPAGTPRVGLAFELQVVATVPSEGHDAPVDAVATERRLLAGGRPLR